MSNILILGGDGYLGWPTAMHLSNLGHAVTVIDNYLRRNSSDFLDVAPLYTVPNLIQRAKAWNEVTGKEIKVILADLSEPTQMQKVFNGTASYSFEVEESKQKKIDTVIHFAEQPSAPFSVMNAEYADLTLVNNLRVTNNLIWSVKEYSPNTHIIKLGTMGEYGTPNIDIEEGWLNVKHNGREQKFLYPRQASSLYHTTKIMDTDLLWYAVRMWDLKVTDLMQGPVYGLETPETLMDDRLQTIFNYDEIFGTVINRFIVQTVAGYPLTVYGAGGQTRGYLNIIDTLQCLTAACEKPAQKGELRIFNQIMETFTVNELALKIKRAAVALGYDVTINKLQNPRKEAESHYYNPTYQGLKDIGVTPHLLNDNVIKNMIKITEKYKDDIRRDIIFKGIKW